MTVQELLNKNRSYRRFQQGQPLDEETLLGLVELTRFCPSSANRQPLRYLPACSQEENEKIFPHLHWAAALRDWHGPEENQRPAGYIIVLGDKQMASSLNVDAGIAAQSILLAAVEQGLGGCMIGSVDRDGLRKTLNIPSQYIVVMVIALGTPAETVVLEDVNEGQDLNYWRDENDVHHVPKRPLSELVLRF